MKILNICYKDYAGMSFRLTEAINKHTKHESRQLVMWRHGWGYPLDILTDDKDEMCKWLDWADIVNCWGHRTPLDVTERTPDKLIIIHRGTKFRGNPAGGRADAQRRNAHQLVCTPDLLLFPELQWLPNAVPVDEWAKLGRTHKGKPIVCQTPSSPGRKNTAGIIEALSNKKNIELSIFRGQWPIVMAHKGIVDIYLGQFTLGYGMNILEVWAMGKPVITHVEEKNAELIFSEVGYLPHYESTLENLPHAVDALLKNKALYREYAELGKKYVREVHDYPVVAKRFISFCEEKELI